MHEHCPSLPHTATRMGSFMYGLLKFVCRYFLAVLCSMWDLSSLTRDETRPPALEAGVLTTGLLGKSAEWSSFTLLESK